MITCPNGHPADGNICVSYKCERISDHWVQFTKRTDNPKLQWLQAQLKLGEIPFRQTGKSFHAPILQVPARCLANAWKILDPVDDLPDDHEMFTNQGSDPDFLIEEEE